MPGVRNARVRVPIRDGFGCVVLSLGLRQDEPIPLQQEPSERIRVAAPPVGLFLRNAQGRFDAGRQDSTPKGDS